MKDLASINENELDGALNALFLETYSHNEDEGMARFCMEQEYTVTVNSIKEAEFLARLNGKKGGGKNILLLIFALILSVVSSLFLFNYNKEESPADKAGKEEVSLQQQIANTISDSNTETKQIVSTKPSSTNGEKLEEKIAITNTSSLVPNNKQVTPIDDVPPKPSAYAPSTANDSVNGNILPYFNKEGLDFFAKIKERMIQKLVKIDDFLYAKTEPGVTMYKNREVLVSPFVMSNFPVTNLQYKTFLADLVLQGREDEMKKCLPKEEIWKEYGCTILAKHYFENESYNDFPVVNIEKEACIIFCKWLQEETNQKLANSAKTSKTKGPVKKKQVIVRLPYDYEWIYSADAAYTLIPNCAGYNTIYDAGEGLVDKGFYKRTSQISKRDLLKETRMDKLSDVNRFGMTEAEMISIFKEAMNYKDYKSNSSVNPSDPLMYPNNIEACCLAGHVSELIQNKEGDMKVRGCCWQNKDEYLKMMETYTKVGASPFIGFRVVILNTERGSDKNPFW